MRDSTLILVFIFMSAFFRVPSARAYLSYVPNAGLMETVESDPENRVLPHGSHYAIAGEGDFFKPVFVGYNNPKYYRGDFYHGNGYWVDLRGEFKPVDDLILNLKTDFTHGTSSNGYSYGAEIIPHIGATYRNHSLLGFDWEGRLSDIGRQTLGTGLFIEEKETEGGDLVAKRGTFSAKMMVDGTGSYQLEGGVVAFDASLWDGYFGGTYLIQETEITYAPAHYTGSIYSKHEWSNGLSYGVEWGANQNATAEMAYAQYHAIFFDRLNLMVKPQVRHYGHGILGTVPKHIMQNYVSYDQNDKPFTNPMDIFVYGDNVTTYSSQLNLEYVFNSFYRYYVEGEALRYFYHNASTLQAFYYRTGFKFYPFHGNKTEIGVLIGNKYLIASTSVNGGTDRDFSYPLGVDTENKPLFLQQTYCMVNLSTQF